MAKTTDLPDTDLPEGVVIRGAIKPGWEALLSSEALAFVAGLERKFGGRAPPAARPARRDPAPPRCRLEARFPGRDQGDPRRRLAGGADPARHRRPPHRDHRPDRPQDGDQRAELRGQCLHGRFRGRDHALLGQSARGAGEFVRCGAADHRLRRSRDRPALRAERQDRGAVRAAARLASAGKACAGRWRADVGRAVRFRPVLFPQRQGIGGARHRPLFLSAEDREPSRGPAVERGVRACAGGARPAQGHDQGDRADRDHPRRLRDGRDPLRAARPFGRAQLRALGLHLQHHQEIRRGPGLPDAGPRAGDDGEPLSAQLQPAADQDLPPAQRPCDGRHGGADPDPRRSGGQRGGDGKGARRQAARGRRRP